MWYPMIVPGSIPCMPLKKEQVSSSSHHSELTCICCCVFSANSSVCIVESRELLLLMLSVCKTLTALNISNTEVTRYKITNFLAFFKCGGLMLAGCQMPTPAALSHSVLIRAVEKNNSTHDIFHIKGSLMKESKVCGWKQSKYIDLIFTSISRQYPATLWKAVPQ